MAENKVPTVFPPGAILEEELEARGWSQVELASILGRPVKVVNDIIAGRRAITPETAIGLAGALGTSAELWMNLESRYQLAKVKGSDVVAQRAYLHAIAPVKEMERRGWIKETDDVKELASHLCAFFRVHALEDIAALPHAAKKATRYDEDPSPGQRAWVQHVRNIAESMVVGRFTSESFQRACAQLKTLLQSKQEIRQVPRILADAGIRLVVVEHLAGTRIDGVCLWLSENEPVIGISVRFDRIDHFWFVLAHELAHVFYRDGQQNPVLDVDLVGAEAVKTADKPEIEKRADAWAEDFLIPTPEMNHFIERVSPMYSKDRIKGFAARLKIHPGIVVGQLQHREEIKFSHSREMLEKVRAVITETALTDGWKQQA
jgi:HTH-type transcriptional regulator/antitoxin HigA